MDQQEAQRHQIRLQYVELLILATALLATVVISALTLRQTTEHFKIERTSGFVARFNSRDMVKVREQVDAWLRTSEKPAELYWRSRLPTEPASRDANAQKVLTSDPLANLRTMANFFQEFGAALKIGSLDERYAHELLGSVCIRYAKELEPFIEETRRQLGRPQLYQEVVSLRVRMEALDKHEG